MSSASSKSSSSSKTEEKDFTNSSNNSKNSHVNEECSGKMSESSKSGSTARKSDSKNNKQESSLTKISTTNSSLSNEEAKTSQKSLEYVRVILEDTRKYATDKETIKKLEDIGTQMKNASDNPYSKDSVAIQYNEFYKQIMDIRNKRPSEPIEEDKEEKKEIIDYDEILNPKIIVHEDLRRDNNSFKAFN